MTGTAIEAAGELRAVYGLKVVSIPTNRPLQRKNHGARILADAEQKWRTIVETAERTARSGRAVLIGTRSVEASERVGELLRNAGLDPVILNARQDREEAEIVARAGKPGRITVATNMAGRGTDIKPDRDVLAAGGLHVILTEYHESARIDRQLFGRAGRQGDPGSFEAIVATTDELFRRFGGASLKHVVQSAGFVTRTIPPALLILMRRKSQMSAERLHARTRRMALAEDQRLQKVLSFAGYSE
jgi:preprotein translocase subunit SecA